MSKFSAGMNQWTWQIIEAFSLSAKMWAILQILSSYKQHLISTKAVLFHPGDAHKERNIT